jgi:CRP-like cAMP-binding protein
MSLPINLPEASSAGLSSRVAVTIGGRTLLDIRVGLSRSRAQARDEPALLRRGQPARSALPDEERAGLAGGVSSGCADNRQAPQPVSHASVQEIRVSENENTVVVNFWGSLSSDEKHAFRSMAGKRAFASGARLMQEGEQANHVAVILSGWTEIRVYENDGERVVARRGPGQLIGERAALQVSVRSATVVAIQAVVALVMRTEDFAAFVTDHPAVLAIVEDQIFTRLRERPAAPSADPHSGAHDDLDGEWARPGRSGHRSGIDRSRRHLLLRGENCTVLRTDVVAFGADERTDEDRGIIRQATLDMTQVALGPAWEACVREDRGDGLLIVAPPSVRTAQVIARLLTVLPGELRRHNRIYSDPIRVQLRVAVDVGPVTEDSIGVSGKSLILAARMLDAPAFKQAIADAGAIIGIIASPFVYETAVKHGGCSLDAASYAEVAVQVKETCTAAWMRLIEPAGTASWPPRPAAN